MERKIRNVWLVIFLVVLFVISLVLLYGTNDNKTYVKQELEVTVKKYKENEYIPVNISYDQVARIYLQDYVNKLFLEPETAYNLLDEEYRKVRFPTYERFLEYFELINTLKFREVTVVDYAINENGNIRYYEVHDADDNLFIFKEKGVMQYSVFFDKETVNLT